MPQRREWRVPFAVPVRVSGIAGTTGAPFAATAYTVDISRTGVRLTQADFLRRPGDRVTLQYQQRRARFRVVWVGQRATPDEGQVGLALLDGESQLWGVDPGKGDPDEYRPPAAPIAAETAPVLAAPAIAAPAVGLPSAPAADPVPEERTTTAPTPTIEPIVSPPGSVTQEPPAMPPDDAAKDRRSTPRFECDRAALCWREGSSVPLWCNLRDVSSGGCYLETRVPYEVGTVLTFQLLLYGVAIRGTAEVRVCDPTRGMGLRFNNMRAIEMQKLDAVLNRLGSPSIDRARNLSPRDLILRRIESWFQRHDTLPRDEYLRLIDAKEGG